MATDQDRTMSTDARNLVSLTLTHHGKPHTFTFASDATIEDVSDEIASTLYIPASNQKLMVSKLGLLRPPFKDPSLSVSALASQKITLMGSTVAEIHSVATSSADAAAVPVRQKSKQTVKAYVTHDWKKEQEENLYTFTTLRPLPYLPNPDRSLQFLQRLKDDIGIKTCMRKHKFTVPLLTEMNPIEHTQSDHTGTSRTLGLNRNAGQVIELRLRTDAYDGYRDYKTIRKTLCHELAHNVHGPHDRNFWDLCKQIEKEVEGSDWSAHGRTLGEGYGGEEIDDHGGWEGGEFVLGSGGAGTGGQEGSMREVLARAAEERIKRLQDQNRGNDSGS